MPPASRASSPSFIPCQRRLAAETAAQTEVAQTRPTPMPEASEAHHRGHKLWAQVFGLRLLPQHACGAASNNRDAHSGPTGSAPPLHKDGRRLRRGQAHPVEAAPAQHTRQRVPVPGVEAASAAGPRALGAVPPSLPRARGPGAAGGQALGPEPPASLALAGSGGGTRLSGPAAVSTRGISRQRTPRSSSILCSSPFFPASRVSTTWGEAPTLALAASCAALQEVPVLGAAAVQQGEWACRAAREQRQRPAPRQAGQTCFRVQAASAEPR
jgi:hypothetical protein